MSASHVSPADTSRRSRLLRELGITPWVWRGGSELAPLQTHPADRGDDAETVSEGVTCVVILPETSSTRELDLLGRVLSAFGAELARAARIKVGNSGMLPEDVPLARAYLVFGEPQAHALGRVLSAQAMQQAQIILADELTQVLARAAAKRRLWSALRSVRRALRAPGG